VVKCLFIVIIIITIYEGKKTQTLVMTAESDEDNAEKQNLV